MKLEYPNSTPQADRLLELAYENITTPDLEENLMNLEERLNKLDFYKPVTKFCEDHDVISIEGLNGSLKSTIIQKLINNPSQPINLLRYRFDEINKLDDLNSMVNLYFANLSEKEHYYNVKGMSNISQILFMSSYGMFVWEQLQQRRPSKLCTKGNKILVDRMHDSSITIQTLQLVSEKISMKSAMKFLINIYDNFGYPNKTILLDFPVKSCINRIQDRRKNFGRIRKDLDCFDDLYVLDKIQQRLVKKNSERYITVQSPELKVYWKGCSDLDYDLDELVAAITDKI